ncbi:UBX domain-containing protein 11 [Nibea albiflora]|uniref:UBX domain-containing protein 11 n=1 Tax=Nibea albiflora TaxID=240163 RepID=A0ACB7F7A7_NIBAL|nr:UBX domain-containing protein 11 [Nibea albiflora]
MSSPLSMLKKTKRSPLHDPPNEPGGRQKVPFRRNLLKEVQAELAAADESSDRHPPHAGQASTSKSKALLKKGTPPSDFELMSAMMQRVTVLEKTVKSQAQEIDRKVNARLLQMNSSIVKTCVSHVFFPLKDKQISALEGKLKHLKESEGTHDLSRDDLGRKCRRLQNQVCEMESFLNDYGLMWVGDGESSDSAESEQPLNMERSLSRPDASGVRKFHMNFDLVLQRIRELNILAGEGECFVRSTATGAQLAKKDPIQLSLYSNGIVMFEGPFRSYEEHSTQRCMQDLMDGYFPSELQERFPDGVPFEVHDRREEEFISRLTWNKFPGEGQAVRGQRDESGKKQSMDRFWSRLPKSVVKAGRVIDVRDSLRADLQGSSHDQSSNSVILIDTPALQAVTERLQTSSSDRPVSARDVITLKVKSEDGNHTFILKMCFSETIGHLRQYLDKHREGGLPGYDIISTYPQCSYDDESQTLQSCGLTSNVTLLLRKRKRPQTLTEVK